MLISLTYTVAGGMLCVLAAGLLEQIAWRFLRLAAVIVLAILAGAVAWSVRELGPARAFADWRVLFAALASFGAVALVFLAPAVPRNTTVFRTVCAAAGLISLAAASGCAVDNVAQADAGNATSLTVLASNPAGVLAVAGQIGAGLLLGSITLAWLLGHAYLTATRMTIAPLRRFTALLIFSAAVRAACVFASMAWAWVSLRNTTGTQGRPAMLELMHGSWLILVLRIGVGLVAVGVFAWMVRECVRIRSTQSATGILYFGSLFAYVGELAAWQLSQQWGWPV